MSTILIHLSDIHFGQEKKNDDKDYFVHTDARDRLIDDVRHFAERAAPNRIAGVMVTGDIAYMGIAEEYEKAGEWLDRLTETAGCKRADVQIVPGNHDIDWGQISSAAEYLLSEIATGGEERLNKFLANENDRDLLYRRFHAYGDFADAYNCPLDKSGGGAGDRTVEIAPGRMLRFIGLNTALACSKKDTEGKLLLGERQRVLPRTIGEELVVLAHHPLKWMRDADDAIQYVRSRARVLVTGHEHLPSVRVEQVFEGADLMMLEAGATTPPGEEEGYTYAYNLLEFSWDEESDGLSVTIHPRCWSEDRKEFVTDEQRVDPDRRSFILACPRFREAPRVQAESTEDAAGAEATSVIEQQISVEVIGEKQVPTDYPDIILQFFRDLLPGQRLKLLVDLGAVPDDWAEPLSQGNERLLLDMLIRDGKVDAVRNGIDAFRDNGDRHEGEK